MQNDRRSAKLNLQIVELIEGWTKIILLRVIPTMTFLHFVTGKSSGVLSDIFSGIRSSILSGISSGILPGISSGICSGISSDILSVQNDRRSLHTFFLEPGPHDDSHVCVSNAMECFHANETKCPSSSDLCVSSLCTGHATVFPCMSSNQNVLYSSLSL